MTDVILKFSAVFLETIACIFTEIQPDHQMLYSYKTNGVHSIFNKTPAQAFTLT
jgi:hypothetical protein